MTKVDDKVQASELESEKQSADNPAEVVEDKQSNKTFTQSEFDSMVARALKQQSAKYNDYDEVKKQLEELKEKDKERELAEMSEVEKQRKEAQELKERLEKAEQENNTLKTSVLKQEILADREFISMPSAYKKLVKGATPEELIESAKALKEEWLSDIEKVKQDKPDISVPDDVKKDSPKDKANLSFNEKLLDRLKQRSQGKVRI